MLSRRMMMAAAGGSGASYQYYRFTGQGAGSERWLIHELELFTAGDATGSDLTDGLGASTSAGGGTAANAIDNNTTTFCDQTTTNPWWKIDLGSPTVVNSFKIGSWSLAVPVNVKLEASNDDFSSETVEIITFTCPSGSGNTTHMLPFLYLDGSNSTSSNTARFFRLSNKVNTEKYLVATFGLFTSSDGTGTDLGQTYSGNCWSTNDVGSANTCFDNNSGTYIYHNNTTDYLKTVGIDLESETTINSILINVLNSTAGAWDHYLESSNDGWNWTQLGPINNGVGGNDEVFAHPTWTDPI